jgi:flagellar hook-length control protein FliK
MAGSLIDTLLQTVAAPRTTEPSRGADNRGSSSEFRPVFDEALTAGPKAAGPVETPPADDDAAEASTVAQSDAFEPDPADDAAQESDWADCSLPNDSDHEASDAAEENGAVAVGDETGNGDETDEQSEDAVEISLAAAEAAAALEASKPKVVTANTTEENDAIGDVLTAAKAADPKNAASDAAAKRAEETSDAFSQSTEVEVGDVRAASAEPVGDAAPDLTTMEKAVEEAQRKVIAPPSQRAAKTKDPSEANPKLVAAEVEGEDAAQNVTPSVEVAVGGEAPTVEEVKHEAADDLAEHPGDVVPDSTSVATRDRQVEPNSHANATSRNEVPESAPTSAAPSVPTAPQSTTDVSSAATPVTAVATPTINTNENGAAHRSATAIARLSAERSLQPGGGQGDDVDAARFVSRVEGAVRAAHQRDGRVQVRLSPPELGALRIELTIQNGVMSARLEAETPAARNLLLDNLPALRDRLAQQDVRIDQFDVDVRRDSSGSAGGNAGQNGPGDRPAQESDWRQSQQRQDRGGPAAAKRAAPTRRDAAVSDAALDIRV